MGRYRKDTPRLSVKIFNGDTKEQITEIGNRTWMDVGEMFSDQYVSEVVQQTGEMPENIIVLVSAEYTLQ